MTGGIGNTREEPRQNADILPTAVIYRVAGLEIDPSRVTVRRGGQQIALRPKTYQFFLFLLERHDRVVSKEELIGGLWGDAIVTDDVLVRSMGELRKALEEDPKNPKIFKTYPKLGYGIDLPVETCPRLAAQAPVMAPPMDAAGKDRPGGLSHMVDAAAAGRERPSSHAKWFWLAAIAAGVVLVVVGWLVVRSRTGPAPAIREVAWWRLDEGHGLAAEDSSGNRQTGTLKGEARWVEGKLGDGLQLEGLEASVTGKDRGWLPSGSQPRTITAWIKATAPQLEETGIFDYGTGLAPVAQRFFLGVYGDGKVSFGNASTGQFVSGANRVDDQAWHLAAGVYEGPETNMARIYIDGKLDRSQKLESPPSTPTRAPWSIGHFLYGGSAFRGTIDDVRVFDRALNEARVSALYRCSAQVRDLDDFYYLPIMYERVTMGERRPEDPSTPFGHDDRDYGGVQLVRSDKACGMESLRGADVGQDLRISADLLVPADAARRMTQAGPYFRSRSAAPGDGIIGGRSAGYWVQLCGNGMVRVARLNPGAIVAFSPVPAGFDPGVFHHLEIVAQGTAVETWVDGKPVTFNQEGKSVERVAILSAWDGIGDNQGAAGIAFGAQQARNEIGGQQVRNFRLETLRK
jgi:DNA-binding winged helix-turn-helix (wHTH) protein